MSHGQRQTDLFEPDLLGISLLSRLNQTLHTPLLKVLIEIFGIDAIGTRLYSDAKLVGLQPSTKKYKDVAPVTSADSENLEEPYPTSKKDGLNSLGYIDTSVDIHTQLDRKTSYPIDLTEIDRLFGELRPLGQAKGEGRECDKENASHNSEILPATPTPELKEHLTKVLLLQIS